MVPPGAKKCFDKASKLLHKNKVDDALKELNKALGMWPRYAAALSLRGFLEMTRNQHQKALNDFSAAVANDPGYAPAYVGLAADYNRTGKFDMALKVLDRSKPFTSGSWQLHFEASKALLGMKSFTSALKEANEASKIYGQELPDFRLVRAQAYLQLKQTEAAIRELRECLAKESKGPRAEKIRQFLSALRK